MTWNNKRRIALGFLACLLRLFLQASPSEAEELSGEQPAAADEQRVKRLHAEDECLAAMASAEEQPLSAFSAEDIITAIQLEAQQILEERRRNRLVLLKKNEAPFSSPREFTQEIGWESNPSKTRNGRGSAFLKENLYLEFSKPLTRTFTWQGRYSAAYFDYLEVQERSNFSQKLTPIDIFWRPGETWQLHGGVDLDYLWAPESGFSYRDLNTYFGVRQNLRKGWYHEGRYEWFVRKYTSAIARSGSGARTSSHRHDDRNTFIYDIGTTWKKSLIDVEQKWYLNDSNNAFKDPDDLTDYRLTASITRPLTPKLSLDASYSFERIRYAHRSVTGNSNKVRRDDQHTGILHAYYRLNPTWILIPKIQYQFGSSNDSTGEFEDFTVSTALKARF